MAIVVEDGNSIVGANSYMTVVEVKAHFVLLGTVIPTITDEQWEAGLLTATNILEYHFSYKGSIADVETPQVLLWPRTGLYDRRGILVSDTTIPDVVKSAQAELALAAIRKILTGARFELSESHSDKGVVIKEKLGPMEKGYSDSKLDRLATVTKDALDYVEMLLAIYLDGNSKFSVENKAIY